jgi:outer membrane lipoprotein SlyB
VGSYEGENVGLQVGANVGDLVGLLVGVKVGLLVGMKVGENVGQLVGVTVGQLVGLVVGWNVGGEVEDTTGICRRYIDGKKRIYSMSCCELNFELQICILHPHATSIRLYFVETFVDILYDVTYLVF